MINKRTSILSISLAVLLIGFLAIQLPQLQFDYELENFFPIDDPDLTYYEEFSKTFGHDNDYLLLGFETEGSLFEEGFLTQVNDGLSQVAKHPSTTRIHSPTTIKSIAKTPMGFIPIPLLHVSNPSKLKRDSVKLFQHELYREMFVSKSSKSLKAIVIHDRFRTKEEADAYVSHVKSIFQGYNPKVRIAGKAIAQTAFVEAVKRDFTKYILISAILIFVWLIVFMRRLSLILTTLGISALSVVATIGLIALTGKKIDVLSSLIPTILLVVSMSNIIHLFSHVKQELTQTDELKTAIKKALKQVGIATALTSLTTSIGFLTLIMINVSPIIDLGVYVAAGVTLAFVITYLLYPTVLVLNSKKASESNQNIFLDPLIGSTTRIVHEYKKGILAYSLITLLFCIPGLSRLEIDAYLVNDLPQNDDVRSDFLFFDQEFAGSKPFTISLWTKSANHPIYSTQVISELNKVEQLIKTHTQAGDLISPATMVKLANQNLHRASPSHYKLPATNKEWKQAFRHINKTHLEYKSTKVSTKSLAQITGYFQDLGSKDATLKYTNLLKALDENINHDIIGYRLTGTTLLVDKSHELLSLSLIKGLGLAILIVGLIAGLLFKSWRMVLITLVPNVFPILAVAAIMGYFSIPLNLSTSVIFAISFGIVVDDTIHFLSQFKIEYHDGKEKSDAIKSALIKTGKPILITTIVLTTGFLTFCFSSFSAVFYMGLFVSISFVMALLADLYLLPVLIIKFLPNRSK